MRPLMRSIWLVPLLMAGWVAANLPTGLPHPLPSTLYPSFLRPEHAESRVGLEEIPKALAGLEEPTPERPEKLGFLAWWVSRGAWGPTREALQSFDEPTQQVLQGKINRLVKWLTMRTLLDQPSRYVKVMLSTEIPTAARSLTAGQLSASLDLATLVVRQRMPPYVLSELFKQTLLVAAKVLTPEQFSAALAFAIRVAEHGIDPGGSLQYAVPAIAASSQTSADFQANLSIFERFLIGSAGHGINLHGLVKYGVRAVAQASPTPELFRANLSALWTLAMAMQERHISLYSSALGNATKVLSPEQFPLCLELATRLAKQGIDPASSPGLGSLTLQAIALKTQYEDFEAMVHPALTHTESDSYDGHSYDEVDHATWVELRPTGQRIAPIPIAIVEAAQLEKLLALRSWLWNSDPILAPETTFSYRHRGEQERVRERVAALRVFLHTMVDRFIRHGVLKPTEVLQSVYLVGSYAWVGKPRDIDLFLVVEGERDQTFFTSQALAERGFLMSEFPLDIGLGIVGEQTLMKASRGEPIRDARHLALRCARLYGAVLLAGHDLFDAVTIPRELLEALHDDLLRSAAKADWPELGGDPKKIDMKRRWRQREAESLARFIARVTPSTNPVPLFETTQEAQTLEALTPLLKAGFRSMAQAVAAGWETEGLRAFGTRFGIFFLDARNRLETIGRRSARRGLEGQRRKAAREILVAGQTRLVIENLPIPAGTPAPSTETLPRPADAHAPDTETLPRPADAHAPDTETLPRPAAEPEEPEEPSPDLAGLEAEQLSAWLAHLREVRETLADLDFTADPGQMGIILDGRIGPEVPVLAAALRGVKVTPPKTLIPVVIVEADDHARDQVAQWLQDVPVVKTIEDAVRLLADWQVTEPILLTPEFELENPDLVTAIVRNAKEALRYLQYTRKFLPPGDLTPLLAVGLEEAGSLSQLTEYL